MNIQKAQKVLRRAIKDYGITSTLDEETLVAFISVDIVREDSIPEMTLPAKPVRRKEDSHVG